MKVTEEQDILYVMRGLIVYYGKHYWAYFYSEKFDGWFQFNDETIKPRGNFEDVVSHCVISRAIPRIVFFERSDVITSLLTEGGLKSEQDLGKIYFSDQAIKNNNFWNGRNTQKGTKSKIAGIFGVAGKHKDQCLMF